MRLIGVNLEMWGPLRRCSCGEPSTVIILTDKEDKSLPAQDGMNFIFENKLGVDLCGACLRRDFQYEDKKGSLKIVVKPRYKIRSFKLLDKTTKVFSGSDDDKGYLVIDNREHIVVARTGTEFLESLTKLVELANKGHQYGIWCGDEK